MIKIRIKAWRLKKSFKIAKRNEFSKRIQCIEHFKIYKFNNLQTRTTKKKILLINLFLIRFSVRILSLFNFNTVIRKLSKKSFLTKFSICNVIFVTNFICFFNQIDENVDRFFFKNKLLHKLLIYLLYDKSSAYYIHHEYS